MTQLKSPAEWFLNAERAYSEHHQGCAWCGGPHRVRMTRQGAKHIYACQSCDFQASYDALADRFTMIPGEEQTAVSETMLEGSIANLF